MKYSKSQILLLINMQDDNRDYVANPYYAETGVYKPYRTTTIHAMTNKGIVEVVRTGCDNTIFYLKRGKKFDTVPKQTWADYEYAK